MFLRALPDIYQSRYDERANYLQDQHFFAMVALALALHVMGGVVWSLMPNDEVQLVPVRTLNIKLGDPSPAMVVGSSEAAAAKAAENAPFAPGLPVRQASSASQNSRSAEAAASSSAANVNPTALDTLEGLLANKKQAKATPEPLKSQENNTEAERAEAQRKQNSRLNAETTLTETETVNPSKPQQLVRPQTQAQKDADEEAGSPYSANISGTEAQRRYTQLLSLWMDRQKVYPSSAQQQGLQGEAVLRIRIDRRGNILYYFLEKPTGHAIIDQAIRDMVQRVNPVPSVPDTFPGGAQLEFLIPLSFRLR